MKKDKYTQLVSQFMNKYGISMLINVDVIFSKRSVFQCLPTIIIPLAFCFLTMWWQYHGTLADVQMLSGTLLNLMLKGLPIKHFAALFL